MEILSEKGTDDASLRSRGPTRGVSPRDSEHDTVMTMTKLLERAIARARELPPEEQDVIAAVLLSMADAGIGQIAELDEETRAAIREGLDQAERGEFVPDEEIEALWKRHGL